MGFFIDLQKAFDTVEHNILLGKLKHYGIRGVGYSWFDPYLKIGKDHRFAIKHCKVHHSTNEISYILMTQKIK